MTHRKLTLNLRPIACAVLYMAAGIPLTAIAQQNTIYQYQYDAAGNRTKITDPLNRVTDNTFDALNRLKQQLQPAPVPGGTRPLVKYGYDGLDQLISVTDPRNLVTSYTVNGLGNQTALASPDTGSSAKTYDEAGNVQTSMDAKGQTTGYKYDVLNRITRITYADGKITNYTYDQGTYGLGRLTQVTDANTTIGYVYNQKGRLATETRIINDVTYVTGYIYDSAGRLATVTYPSGRLLTYGRDAMGRINSISTTKNGVTMVILSQVVYQPFGGIKSYVNGAGKNVTRGYDLDGRITSYTLGNTTQALGYDAASRIGFITDASNPANTQNYVYDDLDRLTQYTGTGTNQGYGYDATGNRTSQVIGANTYSSTIGATSNKLTQITGPATNNGFSYDANGSRTNDATRQLHYDARGRMDSATTAQGTIQHVINPLGQRVQKVAPDANTHYHYDGSGQLIGESTAQGVFQKEYVYLGDMPVALFQ